MKNFFISLTGKFSWEKPYWVSSLTNFIRMNPKKACGIFLSFILAIGLIFTAYWFYQKLPKPQSLSAHFYIPSVVIKNQQVTPQPLRIVFDNTGTNSIIEPEGDDTGEIQEENYLSVAPLDQVGKTITQGAEIKPFIAGNWQWQTDKLLVFIPESAWQSGTDYTVHFSKSLFAKTETKYRMSSWSQNFKTVAFTLSVTDFKFFQDVIHPERYKISATVDFNYPLDNDSLTSNTQLVYLTSGKQIPFKISYNTESMQAYIQADIQNLPDTSQAIKLNIDKNIKPLDGGAPTEEAIQERLMIPDKNNIMKINKISTGIVRNDKGQPEQIITVDTAAVTTTEDLQKFIHVYLLPRDYPATANSPIQKNYLWTNPGEVKKSWLDKSVEITPIPTEHDYETQHGFKIHVTPGQYIYIAIDSGLPSFNKSYTLTLPYNAIAKAPDYPKEISFLHQGSLLTLTGEKKLSVIIRGLPAVKFTIARVLPDAINHLITQTSGNFGNPQFMHDSFDSANISILNSKIEMFNNDDQSKAQYTALDLSKYLDRQPFKLGLFLLKAEGYNPETKSTTDTNTDRLILITDNDILVKNDANGSHDVFIHSIVEGNAVANAQVSVLGKNGLPLMTKTTDGNGHVLFPTFKDFINDKEPIAYVVSKGDDISFMPYSRYDRSLNYSRFNVGGDTSTHQYGLNAYLFSDRGIYRPGEQMHLAMLVKGAYASAAIPDIPLELIITDPRGMTVYDKKLSSSASGMLSDGFTLNASALTGTYLAALHITRDDTSDDLLGSTSFQVQEFEPDQLKLSAKFNPAPIVPEGWVSPQNLKAKIQLWNLFGTPATNRRIKGTLYFVPQALQFSIYPDTIFNDPYRDLSKEAKVFSETLADNQTDSAGQTIFNLDLSRYSQSTYQLTLLAQGFVANGGRGVSQTAAVLVSPAKYLIGYKAKDNLHYIQKNAKALVNFIAVNPELKKIAVNDLKIKLIKINKITTLVKQADGSYQYQNVSQEHEVSQSSFTIKALGNDYSLPTDQIGDYKVQITNLNDLLMSEVAFSVIADAKDVRNQNTVMQIKLNKQSFAPGETIQLNINAPYTGSGLITIERDKVYAFKWFKMNSTSKIESITIPADFEGTGYINVALVRDWNSEEIFMNPLAFSVQDFSVIPDKRNINVKLDVPERVYPGNELNIKYSTDKPGKIIIYAVDEGILQVADYKTPDPLGYYFQKQALSVDTAQIADQILPKYIANRELSAIGGDEKQKSIASNLNPFARKLAPVVYWSGILDAESTARSVIYKIPDYFNGTLRVMAVAVNSQAVGAKEYKVHVKDDYILTPNVPAFVAPNDQFDVSLSITNTTNIDALVKLQVKQSPFIEIQGQNAQSVSVPSNGEKTIIFKLKAKDFLTETVIDFVANVGNKSFKRQAILSIRPITQYQTMINSGYSTTNSSISITQDLYPELRSLQAFSSTNPFILLGGLKKYLELYPYNCTEQLVSQAFVGLALKNQPGYTNQAESFDATYSKVIQILRQRQTSDGSFNYWPSGRDQDVRPFVSIYATDFLTEAKIRKYNVPSDLFSNAIAYLKDYASTNPNSMEDARAHAYAIYILTRNEIITTDYIANLQAYFEENKGWQSDISSAYLAAAYKILQNSAMANKLITNYQLGKKSDGQNSLLNTRITDAAYISVLANYFPDQLAKLKASSLMPLINNLSDNYINSLIAATSALALSNYARILPAENANNQLSISVTNSKNETRLLTSNQFGPGIKKIYFDSKNHTPYFYQVIQSGFTHDAPTTEIKSGLEVYREYRDKQGAAVTSVDLGNELEVHLKLRGAKNIYDVAVVDLLPGGFELVPNSITGSTNYLNYYDAREDRIIFYVTATTDSQEYIYRIRATNRGIFSIPPIFATSMYNPKIVARQKGGTMQVK